MTREKHETALKVACYSHAVPWDHVGSSVHSSCLISSGLISAVLHSAASWQLELNARQWNGNKQSENPPRVKTWRTYHNTVSKPRASLLHPFPGVSSPSTTLPSSHVYPSSVSLPDLWLFICLLCLWQQAVFTEQLSPHRHRCPTHRPLLTFDLDSPTCPLTHTHAHTLHTSCSVSFVHLWRQTPFSAAD